MSTSLLVGCAQPESSTPAASEEAAADLASDAAKASYTIGYGMTDDMRTRMTDDFDSEAFLAGAGDAVNKATPRVSQEEGQRTMRAMAERAQAAVQQEADESMATGAEYLAKNAEREGVTVLPSGLQYEVLTAGSGPNPEVTDTVTTHYEGKLLNGEVFDSSVERGEPASFPLNRVIPGWTEALQLMQPGAKWRLHIPPGLAYGDRGAGSIPPNSTLIFEVELLSIQGKG
ncbi:MAG: FKBP-type peptidyl-prolyl cis-trans isomerase [Pseudomonadales bacterium]